MIEQVRTFSLCNFSPTENGVRFHLDDILEEDDIPRSLLPDNYAFTENDIQGEIRTVVNEDDFDGVEVRYTDELSNTNTVRIADPSHVEYDEPTSTYNQINFQSPSNPKKFNTQGLVGKNKALAFAVRWLRRYKHRKITYDFEINRKHPVRPCDVITIHAGYNNPDYKRLMVDTVVQDNNDVLITTSKELDPAHPLFVPSTIRYIFDSNNIPSDYEEAVTAPDDEGLTAI